MNGLNGYQIYKDAGVDPEEYEEDMYVDLFEEGGSKEEKICEDNRS